MPNSSPARHPRRKPSTGSFARSNRSLLAVLDAAPEAVVVIDSADRIVFANGVVTRLWDSPSAELLGRSVGVLFGPRFGFVSLDAPDGESFVTEAEAVRGDGVPFTVHLNLQRARIGQSLYRTIWMRPALRVRDEVESRCGRRIQAALERFASGLAHEWNNVLTVVLGNLHLAMEDVVAPGRTRAAVLDGAYQASLRGRELARGLLDFAVGEFPAVVPQPAAPLAWESSLLGLRGTRVQLDRHFPADLWQALVDPAQAGQAFHYVTAFLAGLAVGGGRLRLTARNWTAGAPGDTCGGRLLPGDFVVFSLTIDQIRFRDEDLEQLFYPFADVFGANTGMRLAVARAILARQDGWLNAGRTSCGGTAFHFYLPAHPAPFPSVTSIDFAASPVAGLHILVMDDEQLVRLVLQRTLEGMGHRIVAVSQGAEAVNAYAEAMKKGDRFDLVILDLKVSTGMGGLEACSEIVDFDPLATCVLSSGSVRDDAMLDCRGYGFAGILEKPFEPSAVLELLRELSATRSERILNSVRGGDEELVQLLADNILTVDFKDPGRRWDD